MEGCIKGRATGVARIMLELFALAGAVCRVLRVLLGFSRHPLRELLQQLLQLLQRCSCSERGRMVVFQ